MAAVALLVPARLDQQILLEGSVVAVIRLGGVGNDRLHQKKLPWLMAARMSWPNVYLVMVAIFLALLVVTLTAPDTPRPERQKLYGALAEPGALKPNMRALLLGIVGGIRNRAGNDQVSLLGADVALPLFERQIVRDAKQPALEITT